MRFDGRPQDETKNARLLVEHEGKEIWLTTRCYAVLERITACSCSYADLKQSPHDRVDEIMCRLRKELQAQGGPAIKTIRKGHYAYFEVVG